MRWIFEIDGRTFELDRFAAVALRIIGAVIAVQGRPITREFSVSELLLRAAQLQERSDQVDADAARLVRTLIENSCDPQGKRRTRHLRLVRSPDSDGSPSPQAGV